jgi:hypothetical protein
MNSTGSMLLAKEVSLTTTYKTPKVQLPASPGVAPTLLIEGILLRETDAYLLGL